MNFTLVLPKEADESTQAKLCSCILDIGANQTKCSMVLHVCFNKLQMSQVSDYIVQDPLSTASAL